MENTLYYTFSTIPQVLAASIALLGVFWIFKVPDIKKRLMYLAEVVKKQIDMNDHRGYCDRVADHLIEKNGLDPNYTMNNLIAKINLFYEQDNFKGIYRLICDIEEVEQHDTISKTKESFEKLDQEKTDLTNNSKYVLVLSGIQIVLSVIILMFVPKIAQYCCLPYLIMIISAVFFGFNIFLMIRTIWITLKVEKYT